jgi:hypothetical protein
MQYHFNGVAKEARVCDKTALTVKNMKLFNP